MESLSQSARAQLSQQLATLQHQQMPATFTLGAKGNNGFSHTYNVTISQGADAQYHADVSRNYLFGKGSSDGKTSRALATYIQSQLPQPQRQQPLSPPALQQVQPLQPNPQTQRQQTFDQIFPPLPPRSDDEERALRDARYQRDKHQTAFVAIQPAPQPPTLTTRPSPMPSTVSHQASSRVITTGRGSNNWASSWTTSPDRDTTSATTLCKTPCLVYTRPTTVPVMTPLTASIRRS